MSEPLPSWRPPRVVCPAEPYRLSGREAQVLVGLCLGHTSAGMAARLSLTENSVKTHLRRLYRKLGARDRAHAVAIAHACPPVVAEQGGAR